MNFAGRRLIVDRGFDRAMEAVLGAFLQEGFSITPVSAGDLCRTGNAEHSRRYALIDAALPELHFESTTPFAPPALFRCRVSMFELAGSFTLVTVESPLGYYPGLARLIPAIPERIRHVMRSLRRTPVPKAA
jgi:hypothetical protein